MTLNIAMLGARGVPATFGGVERHVEEIGSRLVARGHEVTVYSQSRYCPERVCEYRGMRVVTLPTLPVRGFEAISHAAMSTAYGLFQGHDVFHYHAVGPGLLAPVARLASGAAVVQTVHGLDADRAKWGAVARKVLRFGTWLSARVPDRTIVVSRALVRHYAERYDRPASYIPNGVNIKSFRDPDLITERYGLRGGDYLLFVGRLVPEKRPDLLLEAFRGLDTDKKLVIVGGSSHTDDYVRELRRLAARDPRVVMTGYAYGAELDELLTNAAGFVQPSSLEGLPLTLLEAIGCGLPVVVSDIEPHLEVIDAGDSGAYVFAADDAASLRRALRRMLTYGSAGAAGIGPRRALAALRTYDWGACVDAVEDIYYSALDRVPHGRPLGAAPRGLEQPKLRPVDLERIPA